MKILTERQIQQKIKRLAIEILENNYNEEEIILAGINTTGLGFATMLYNQLKYLTKIPLQLTRIRVEASNPTGSPVIIEKPLEEIEGKVVIIVDDVANTGRTIFYAMKPLLETLPKKVEAAVLVDRKHKSFPIKVDYVGLSLATTLMENIDVNILDVAEMGVNLD
ncbi:MAG: phosphoribosyltransferase [Bacteroidetes bacterium]|nr:phosphoribosyltransferase [Bacteroidota bacterium]